jgi:hypothetical protein
VLGLTECGSHAIIDAAIIGADLLWRIKSNAALPVEKRYSGGAFASHVYPGTKARRNRVEGSVEPFEIDVTCP